MSTPGPLRAWLHRDTGAVVRVPPQGLRLGRLADCDIVLVDPAASQVQAVLSLTAEGLELLALGRNPTRVNGEDTRGRQILVDQDLVEVPGARLRVQFTPGRAAPTWWVEHPDGHRYAVRRLPWVVGGGLEDDLRVPGWPAGAVQLLSAGDGVAIEFAAPGHLNDEPLPAGAVETPESWDRLTFGTVSVGLRAVEGGRREGSTVIVARDAGVKRAHFVFRPNGAILSVDFGEGAVLAELPELRARLVAVLLQPPRGYVAGDFLPDEALLRAIWPGAVQRDRVDLNVVIHRTRKDLVRAGLNPALVLERPRQGGAARFVLAPGATVHVE